MPKVPNMNQIEVSKIIEQDSEERAALLFETFQRLTSVVFDLQSMTQLLHREDLSESTLETVAHLLFNSLLHLSQMKNLAGKDASATTSVNMVYLKYWEIGTGYLKLSVINELVQSFRTTPRLLHPLLNTLFLLNKHHFGGSAAA